MKYIFEKHGSADIVSAIPESEEDRIFLQLMADKTPKVQGFERDGGHKIETALINFIEKE